MNEVVISCEGLAKTFNQGPEPVKVLDGFNLSVHAGEQLAIVGSSGTGKTTLLQLLGGLDKPTQGQVKVMGQDINQMNERQRCQFRNRNLGFVYQFHHLLPEFSAIENVSMPLLIRGESRHQGLEQAADLLKKLGLAKRLKHRLQELSGGERQRVAIARALVTKPQCVLADEPTGNLDSKTAEVVYDLLLSLNQRFGTALIIVTHDTSLAQRMQRCVQLQ